MRDVKAKIGVPIKKEELTKFMLVGGAKCSDMCISHRLAFSYCLLYREQMSCFEQHLIFS